MTKEEKSRYSEPEALRDILKRVLSGRKFMLDCGHHVMFRNQSWKRHHNSERKRAKGHLFFMRTLNKEVSMCDHDGLDWEDIALIGALSESLSEEARERERLRKELSRNDDDVDEDKED